VQAAAIIPGFGVRETSTTHVALLCQEKRATTNKGIQMQGLALHCTLGQEFTDLDHGRW